MNALLARFPRLAHTLPLANISLVETPIERWRVDGVELLAKRDDLNSLPLGGNKARSLQLLFAGAGPSRTVLTVGATGSTHALAVARHGAWLGLRTDVITWPQESHDVANATSDRLSALATVTAARNVVEAYVRAGLRRLLRRVHWIPAGGSVPLGAIGHVAAALELAAQIEREGIATPEVLVVPLGSGGTVAGLLVGLEIAGLSTRVIGVRVVPRIVANRRRVLRLARRTAELLSSLTGERIPMPRADRLVLHETAYGGAYGRTTTESREAARLLAEAGGPRLEQTYSAKAFAVALDLARTASDGRVLFWLTFDARWLDAGTETRPSPPHER